MAGTTAIVLGSLAAVTALAGAGLSYYGQQQQASSAERMGRYNAAVQEQQMRMQAQMQAAQADAMRQAGMANAATLVGEATRVEQEARERARRMREENERLLSAQRARYGKSGVTSEGSPLMVMAESAAMAELGVADELYKANAERSGILRKAEMERWQANMSILDSSAAAYNLGTARQRALPLLWEGKNTAANYRLGSYGSLISGAGSAAGSLSSVNFSGGGGNTQSLTRRATASGVGRGAWYNAG
jgi:hypothetical protein